MYRSVDGTEAIKTLDCGDADSPLLIRVNGQIALKPDVLKVCHTEVALMWSFSPKHMPRIRWMAFLFSARGCFQALLWTTSHTI